MITAHYSCTDLAASEKSACSACSSSYSPPFPASNNQQPNPTCSSRVTRASLKHMEPLTWQKAGFFWSFFKQAGERRGLGQAQTSIMGAPEDGFPPSAAAKHRPKL